MVLGSRFIGGDCHRVLYFWHMVANKGLTLLSNMLTNVNLTDMECCYKLMPVSLLREIRSMLTDKRFGIEPQLVPSLARLGASRSEVPVQYDPRGSAGGKKIGWTDGVRAGYVMRRERVRGSAKASQ